MSQPLEWDKYHCLQTVRMSLILPPVEYC